MAYSRTSTPSAGSSSNSGFTSNKSSTTNANASEASSSSTNFSQVANTQSSGTKSSDFLDPSSREALDSLLQSLLQAAPGSREGIKKEIGNVSEIRGDYSKGNAFADALLAMNANLSSALEQQMPTIAAGIDSAGTSGSALSALLTQKAAENSARQAAELGLQAAVSYGQVQAGLSDTIAGLLTSGDSVTNQLLSALEVAKGSTEKTTTSNKETTKTNGSQTQNSTGSKNSTSTTNSTDTTTPLSGKSSTSTTNSKGNKSGAFSFG